MSRRALTSKRLAYCGGMKENTRRRWMNELGLLSTGPEFSEFDAVLTAVAAALVDGSTSHRAPAAFAAIVGDFRRLYLAGRRDLWVVVPESSDEFRLATSASKAATEAAASGELVWVVGLKARIELAKERYARSVSGSSDRSVRVLRADAS
jgi:hypothetical protein